MADESIPSFTTTRYNLSTGDELELGNDSTQSWNEAIETTNGVTVSDSGTVTGSAVLFQDGFDDGVLDKSYTIVQQDGSITETSGELYFSLTGTSVTNTVAGNSYTPGVSYTVDNKTDKYANSGDGGYDGGHGAYFGFRNATEEGAWFWFPQNYQKNTWRTVTSDGSEYTRTDLRDGTDGEWRTYRIEWEETEARFYINGTKVSTHTANIPTSSVRLEFRNSRGTAADTASDIWWDGLSIESL